MAALFDHEKLKAYQMALRFVAWASPLIENLPSKLSARDQLDRASTSIALNLAEGNGKRSYPDRCRYFDIARGSTVECAACLDVLVAKEKLSIGEAETGKAILLEVVAMTAGLIARFSTAPRPNHVEEEQTRYGGEYLIDSEDNE
ncbi:MAG: four helix bundle protein [Opitutus sp.]|nr:four helix bundle protein [Opitutus sp.]MCS6248155.1 four helix bundle protein [Opitutus sp.]MCS6274752.1 four helix bundle protein [Opitutus sp.]MCS6276429.1 four helix bundle protein [Opitutus sp.]MCS6301923.1 four helix bundle protein [Opitutus sp.]